MLDAHGRHLLHRIDAAAEQPDLAGRRAVRAAAGPLISDRADLGPCRVGVPSLTRRAPVQGQVQSQNIDSRLAEKTPLPVFR